jgi:predicted acylesterase/phospholipase RssA
MNKIDYNSINSNIDDKINELIGKKENTKTVLILSGGGVKGIAHVGALKALEEKNILKNIKTIAGTSVGALIAALYLIGWSPTQLYTFIEDFPIKNLKGTNSSGFFKTFGFDDGFKLIFVLEKMFEEKNISKDITFSQLYKKTNIKLIMTTVCLNDKQVYYLSHITFPNMPILLGIRMTTSIPLLFTPVSYNNKLFVDGACIDNFPIHLFSDNLESVIGIYLAENREYVKDISNMEDFLYNLVQCFFEGNTCNSIKSFEKYTIKLNLPMVSIINLYISTNIKKQLYDCGYLSIINKFTYNT